MKSTLIPALKLFSAFTLLTGIIYPAVVTLIAQTAFREHANGSMVSRNSQVVGSSLIAQEFKGAKWFHARPSAIAYIPIPSGGSNLAATSADLAKAIEERKAQGATDDLLFASASGLDPEISPAAARSQAARVAEENQLSPETVRILVENHVEKMTLGFLGSDRVNVLLLNLDLLEATDLKR